MKRQNTKEYKEGQPQPTHIEVVYAGGTISSMVTSGGYREGGHKLDLAQLLQEHSPDSLKNVTLTGSDFAYTGLSENIDHSHWNTIIGKIENALQRSPKSIIVTHGTDSMEQTARHLQKTLGKRLEKLGVSIIITGSNHDTSHPQTDAWDNLEFAFQASEQEQKPGVYVAFHGRLIPADNVVKEPFNGITMHYADRTTQAYKDAVQARTQRDGSIVRSLREKLKLPTLDGEDKVLDYPVNVVAKSHRKVLELVKNNKNISVVLLTLYHSGTANTVHPDYTVVKLAQELRRQGKVVFGVTENNEPNNLNLYETSVALRQAGVIPLYDMTKAVALEKLSCFAHLPAEQMIRAMLKNEVGEIQNAPKENEVQEFIQRYSSIR